MATTRTTRAQVAERRARLLELRIEGKTFDWIVENAGLGYKTRAAAVQDFGRALSDRLKRLDGAVDELRTLELERLDAMHSKAWGVLERPHMLVQGGKVVTIEAPDPENPGETRTIRLQDDGPLLQAILTLLRISERRAKLSGLDAPTEISIPKAVTVEIVGVDLGDLT